MHSPELAQFANESYLSLETFKKSGQGVATPVWFVQVGSTFYVYTEADSWKVKRVRNNSRVRIAPCNIRGKLKGEWIDAQAQIITGEEEETASRMLDQKYFLKRIFNFLVRIHRHKRAMIKIVV
jgi:uncharacterized protein